MLKFSETPIYMFVKRNGGRYLLVRLMKWIKINNFSLYLRKTEVKKNYL
jgi:hypothetical protein